MHDVALTDKLAKAGERCRFVRGAPSDDAPLNAAGVADAAAIMVLSDDDRLNLQVALKARDRNPDIRIVMRQFNRTLGIKLERSLEHCSVLSLASHSAAAFAAAAIAPGCFGALQFPDPGGVLAAFATRTAADLGIAGLTPAAAERRLCVRVVALNGSRAVPPAHVFGREDDVTVFGRVERLAAARPARQTQRDARPRPDRAASAAAAALERMLHVWNAYTIPIRVIGAAAAIFALAVVYFAFALHADPVTAFYFVATTFTSTGYGDLTPLTFAAARHAPPSPVAMLAASVLMFTGVASIGIFIAFATSALTRAQFDAIQGLRQIRTRDHVVVCGCGNVGTRVVEFLRALGRRVVVVELKPDAALVEMSSRHDIALVTGDATRDATLDLCNVAHACAVVAVTDSDTANLEVALGALARNKDVPVVMRVQDKPLADSIERHFHDVRSYSTAALAAPVFAMIARFPKTRGGIVLSDDAYNLAEQVQEQEPQEPSAQDCIPLGVWRNGGFHHIAGFKEMQPFDRVLFLVPLAQFKAVPSQNEEAVAVGTT